MPSPLRTEPGAGTRRPSILENAIELCGSPSCHDADPSLRDAMRKSGVSRSAVRNRQSGPPELLSAAEGQIEEICHELAVQTKRMKQLQEQAQELRTTLRLGRVHPEWNSADAGERTNRGGRR